MPDAAHPSHQRVREAAARQGASIEIVTFDESTHTAPEAAAALGVELGQIVKSLVFVAPADDGQPQAVVALVCGTDRVDVARLAAATELPGLRRATAQEAGQATGYTIGGIPPFGHAHPARVIMDPALAGYEEVWAAAGTPNAVFAIEPGTLQRVADASLVTIAAERAGP